MEATKATTQEEAVNSIYNYAARLLVEEKRTADDVIEILVREGLDQESASIVVSNLQGQIKKAKKEQGGKNMLYGALWCIGGIVATAANIGFIFWGAIVFGGIQFIIGLVESMDT